MPREFSRNQRMAEQIRRDLAELVRNELKDPRIGFLSFTAVKLNRDLSNAIVYCTVLDESQRQETIDTLNRAAGFLRSRIAGLIKARTVPTMKFVLDESVERGAAMEELIRRAVDSDDSNTAGIDDEEHE